MICCWTTQYEANLERGIVLIHVQAALCRCNIAKYNLARPVGINSLENLAVCSSWMHFHLLPQAEDHVPNLLNSDGSELTLSFCFVQCNIRRCYVSRRRWWLPRLMQDHPVCHLEACDIPKRCRITVTEFSFTVSSAGLACAGTGVCHGNSATVSLLSGLPAHMGRDLWPFLILTVPFCGNQVT